MLSFYKYFLSYQQQTFQKICYYRNIQCGKYPIDHLPHKIIFINYYNPYTSSSPSLDRLFSYLNTKTEQLTAKYNIDYVDIYTPFKNNPTYLSNPTNIYPTTTAYSFIANKIIEKHLSNN